MKTLIEVKQAIYDLSEQGAALDPNKNKGKLNKLKKSLQFLR